MRNSIFKVTSSIRRRSVWSSAARPAHAVAGRRRRDRRPRHCPAQNKNDVLILGKSGEGGASLPSRAVRIFRPWTISLVAAELLSAAGYAPLKTCLVASGACIAAPRHASKLRPYEIAVCNVEIEAFTWCHHRQFSLCTPLLEPGGEAVGQAAPERLDGSDNAWDSGNRVKHRAAPFAEDGASLPGCHVGHSRHGYCAVQHIALNLVAASTKKRGRAWPPCQSRRHHGRHQHQVPDHPFCVRLHHSAAYRPQPKAAARKWSGF